MLKMPRFQCHIVLSFFLKECNPWAGGIAQPVESLLHKHGDVTSGTPEAMEEVRCGLNT